MSALAPVLDGVRGALAEADVGVAAIDRRADAPSLRGGYAAATAWIGDLLVAAGDPDALRAAGAGWVDEVAAPVSRLVGAISLAALATDDHWTGAAADAYRATLPAQQSALAAVVAAAQEIDVILDDLAAAIMRFWIAVGAACIGLDLALAGALGTAATAVGVPAAAGIALAGVSALVAAGDAALANLAEVTTAAAARSAALHRRLSDSTAFPFGEWPRSAIAGGWEMR